MMLMSTDEHNNILEVAQAMDQLIDCSCTSGSSKYDSIIFSSISTISIDIKASYVCD
jgi:hypothetical protein